jgi:hypothetical protein
MDGAIRQEFLFANPSDLHQKKCSPTPLFHPPELKKQQRKKTNTMVLDAKTMQNHPCRCLTYAKARADNV